MRFTRECLVSGAIVSLLACGSAPSEGGESTSETQSAVTACSIPATASWDDFQLTYYPALKQQLESNCTQLGALANVTGSRADFLGDDYFAWCIPGSYPETMPEWPSNCPAPPKPQHAHFSQLVLWSPVALNTPPLPGGCGSGKICQTPGPSF